MPRSPFRPAASDQRPNRSSVPDGWNADGWSAAPLDGETVRALDALTRHWMLQGNAPGDNDRLNALLWLSRDVPLGHLSPCDDDLRGQRGAWEELRGSHLARLPERERSWQETLLDIESVTRPPTPGPLGADVRVGVLSAVLAAALLLYGHLPVLVPLLTALVPTGVMALRRARLTARWRARRERHLLLLRDHLLAVW